MAVSRLRLLVGRLPTLLRSLTSRARGGNPVDAYWNEHTVNSTPFQSAEESLRYLEWRFEEYPLFREFMGLYGRHDGEVVLDYGCGPGNDLVGFLVHTAARKVIGLDVSAKALALARQRLALHAPDPARVELIQVTDASPAVPLPADCADYVYCEGVLQHTSNPAAILAEFHRILRPGGRACVMVYNRDSLWLHLYTAYVKQILEGAFAGLPIEEAFARNTDGQACPIARCYAGEEFAALCRGAGFAAEFVGGYLSRWELTCLGRFGRQALEDDRLPAEHRAFLRELTHDPTGYPVYRGKHAGVGGVYRLAKAA
jgi:ubiquinone/menaquinone biosynthesis C-methylase UbiE